MFHRVLPESKVEQYNPYQQRGTLITAEYLSKLLRDISQNGYQVITVRKYWQLYLKGQLESHHIALSFDDGYLDNFIYAKPILDKFKYKASFYPTLNPVLSDIALPIDYYYSCINSNKLSNESMHELIDGKYKKEFIKAINLGTWKNWLHKHFSLLSQTNLYQKDSANFISFLISKIKDRLYMNSKEIMQLHNEGHEIGSHCVSHKSLNKIPVSAAKKELQVSFEWVRKNFYNTTITLAFPNGEFSSKIEELAKDIGYAVWLGVETPRPNFSYPNGFARQFINMPAST